MYYINNILSATMYISFLTIVVSIISYFITIFQENINTFRLRLIKNIISFCISLLIIISLISYYI